MIKESFFERAPILQIFSYKNFDRVNPLIYVFLFGFISLTLVFAIKFTFVFVFVVGILALFALYGYFRKVLPVIGDLDY